MMRKALIKALLISAGIQCMVSCTEEKLTPEEQQYAELIYTFNQLKDEEWMQSELQQVKEAEELIVRYDRYRDATYATPQSKLTMLHLACFFKKPELAQLLLAAGANPNAFTVDEDGREADSPLGFALAPGFLDIDTDKRALRLVNILAKAGANTTGVISHGQNLWSTAAIVCESEELARKLIHYAPPATIDDITRIVERGWANLLQDILQNQEILPEEAQTLLYATALPFNGKSTKVNCQLAELLLQQGADINATCYLTDETILHKAAYQLGMFEDKELREDWLDYIAFLIKKGANPTADIDMAHHGTYAYDFLAGREGVLEALTARGCIIKAPVTEIRPGTHLCNDIIRAQMCRIPTDDILAHFDTIAAIFTPTEEQMANELCGYALADAAQLLERADAARASEVIKNSTLWQKNCGDHTGLSAADLIHALDRAETLSVEPNALMQVAEQAIAQNNLELAATAVQLLGRCPAASDSIDKLCESPHISVRAGAWNAKLQLAGLPLSTIGGGQYWLEQNKRQADTPVLQTILLATSLEEMWCNNMDDARKKQFIDALKTVGAPQEAIRVYGEFANNMDNPEQLDELSKFGDDWKFELEIATAKYIFEHAADILPPAPQKED